MKLDLKEIKARAIAREKERRLNAEKNPVIRVNLFSPTKKETQDFNETQKYYNDFSNWENFNFSYVYKNKPDEKKRFDIVRVISDDGKFNIRIECIDGVLSIVNHNGNFIEDKHEVLICKNWKSEVKKWNLI